MKGYIKYCFAVLFILLLFSCKKETPTANYFEYEMSKYPVDIGMIEGYGKLEPEVTGYNFDVTIHSSGILFSAIDESYSGYGNIIYLEMFSGSADQLSPGTYNFDNAGSMDPMTFDIGRFGMYVDMDEQSGTIILANSGSVTVSKTGEIWTLIFNCATSAGNSITGKYSGELEYYDNTN